MGGKLEKPGKAGWMGVGGKEGKANEQQSQWVVGGGMR